VALDTFNKTN